LEPATREMMTMMTTETTTTTKRTLRRSILDLQDVKMKVEHLSLRFTSYNPPAPQAIIANARTENEDSRWQPNVTYKIKLLVSYAQMAMILSDHGTHLPPKLCNCACVKVC
jgi:hypothetical protein